MKPPVRTRSSRLTPTNELSSDQFPDATPTASRLAQWAKELRKAYPNAGAWSDYNQAIDSISRIVNAAPTLHAKQGVLAMTVNHIRTLAVKHSINTNVTTAPKDAEGSVLLGNLAPLRNSQSPCPASTEVTDRGARNRSRAAGNHQRATSLKDDKTTSEGEAATFYIDTEKTDMPDEEGVDHSYPAPDKQEEEEVTDQPQVGSVTTTLDVKVEESTVRDVATVQNTIEAVPRSQKRDKELEVSLGPRTNEQVYNGNSATETAIDTNKAASMMASLTLLAPKTSALPVVPAIPCTTPPVRENSPWDHAFLDLGWTNGDGSTHESAMISGGSHYGRTNIPVVDIAFSSDIGPTRMAVIQNNLHSAFTALRWRQPRKNAKWQRLHPWSINSWVDRLTADLFGRASLGRIGKILESAGQDHKGLGHVEIATARRCRDDIEKFSEAGRQFFDNLITYIKSEMPHKDPLSRFLNRVNQCAMVQDLENLAAEFDQEDSQVQAKIREALKIKPGAKISGASGVGRQTIIRQYIAHLMQWHVDQVKDLVDVPLAKFVSRYGSGFCLVVAESFTHMMSKNVVSAVDAIIEVLDQEFPEFAGMMKLLEHTIAEPLLDTDRHRFQQVANCVFDLEKVDITFQEHIQQLALHTSAAQPLDE